MAGLAKLPKAMREKTKRQNRDYSRKKVREYRLRKNGLSEKTIHHVAANEETENLKGSYKTPSALSKALEKVKRALPSTPTKKKQVVAKLLQSFHTNEIQEMAANKTIEH